MVVGMSLPRDVTFGAGDETEKLYRQWVSGNVFGIFGLQPALGRLLTPNDDLTPGAHPVAVLSYNYWTRRFGRDPGVIGKTFRIRQIGAGNMGNDRLEIVGVAPQGFTGTEPGEVTDIFLPAMMNAEAINSPGWLVPHLGASDPGVSPEQVRQPLQAAFTHEHRERLKEFHSDTPSRGSTPSSARRSFSSCGRGRVRLQKEYRRPLLILVFWSSWFCWWPAPMSQIC